MVKINKKGNIFYFAVNIQSLYARLSCAVPGGPKAAKRHVWLATESTEIDVGNTCLDPLGKPHGTVDIAGVNGGCQTVFS